MRNTVLAALLCIALGGLAHAQMSGNYTIDPLGSGPANFPTFAAAISTLNTSGVSGPVVFKVASTTFQETMLFAAVTGASSTNTITFIATGAPAVIDANAGAIAMDFAGACQWYVFENLEVKNFTSMGMRFLSSPSRCQNIVLRKVIVDGPATTSTSVHAIDFAQSYFITAEDCVFRGGGYTIYSQGMYYSVFNRCEFDGKGLGSWVVSLWNANAAYCVFTNCFMHGASASGYAMYLSLSHYGTMFWHNVFIGKSTSPVVYLGGCCAWTRANVFRNNIVVQQGTGPAIQINSSATLLQFNDLDYNCYYAPNATAGAYKVSTAMTPGTGFSQGTLASWQTYFAANAATIVRAGGGTQYDQNSIEADPMLVSDTAPYDLHIKGGSPCLDAGTATYVPGAWLGYPPAAAPNLPTTVPADFEGEARGALPDIGADEVAISIVGSGSGKIGTSILFTLSAPADGGLPYQVGSSFGNGPIPIDTRKVELSPDNVLFLSISGQAPGVFERYAGVLTAQGGGVATLDIPNIPTLATIRVWTAFVTLKPAAPSGIQSISNSFLFTIQ